MKLRTIHHYLKNIVKSPDNPSEAIDAFLDAYWLNHIDSESSQEGLWSEIRFLACELKLFDSDLENRKKGFFGAAHAIIITERVIDLISSQLTSKPNQLTKKQDSQNVFSENVS